MELLIKSDKYGDKIVLFDDEDYELVSEIKWAIVKSKEDRDTDVFYARGFVRAKYSHKYAHKRVRMHRIILGVSETEQVDHINHNGLDNRRCNLRIATSSQQTANTRLHCSSTTGFKGVTYRAYKNLYCCRIRVNNNLIGGGLFKNKYQAALKYNELAVKYFGEYACLNNLTQEEIALSKEYIPDRIYKTNKTGYHGVSISKTQKKKYIATCFLNGKNAHLGSYENAEDAAMAYNKFRIDNNLDLKKLNKIPNG